MNEKVGSYTLGGQFGSLAKAPYTTRDPWAAAEPVFFTRMDQFIGFFPVGSLSFIIVALNLPFSIGSVVGSDFCKVKAVGQRGYTI